MNTPLYIFDLDGTLALIEHRLHHITSPNSVKDWDAFFSNCDHDAPNRDVISLLRTLLLAGAEVWIWSGRNDTARQKTEKWLLSHVAQSSDTKLDGCRALPLKMRPDGDRRLDHILKREWLREMSTEDRSRLACVFEDRKRVVDMWRKNGVTALQVSDNIF